MSLRNPFNQAIKKRRLSRSRAFTAHNQRTERPQAAISQTQENRRQDNHSSSDQGQYQSGHQNPPNYDRSFAYTDTLHQKARIKPLLPWLGIFAGTTLLAWQLLKENIKSAVIAESVLRDPNRPDSSHVLGAETLNSAGHEYTSGRSRGHKVYRKTKKGIEFLYFKKPFNRESFIKELIIGSIGKMLLGDTFPNIYAVETPLNDLDDLSHYALASEMLSKQGVSVIDLEKWAETYKNGSEWKPTQLGLPIAFDMLMGKVDSKLANLILIQDKNGHCYSIDHESGFKMPARFVKNAKQAIGFIGEFRKKSFIDYTIEQQSDTDLDTDDNPHQPLKANKAIKNKIAPVLVEAVQADIDNNSMIKFYNDFIALTDDDLNNVFNQFGNLMTDREKWTCRHDIKQRQEATKAFLVQRGLLFDDTLSANNSYSAASKVGSGR